MFGIDKKDASDEDHPGRFYVRDFSGNTLEFSL